jgi:7-cyano-7-deazaguanine tRNA-ribosyltransferase
MERQLPVKGYITNGYIIYSNSALKEKALESGVHSLLDTDLPVMTDSGTFQMYVYGGSVKNTGEKKDAKRADLSDLKPNEIVTFQAKIKSDIITILDRFTEPKIPRDEAEARMKETIKRGKEAVEHKGESALACTVQGGVYPDLREKAAAAMSQINCEVHPVGGVVPLMENYRYADVVEAVVAAKKGLTPKRPVHLFGCGHPMLFPLAVYMGCDIFDSSSYAKYAQDNRMMYPEGTKHLEDISESPCSCVVCSKYTPSELLEMQGSERKVQIALHNLHVSFTELKIIRQAVFEGTLREMVERRARAHPHLMDALKALGRHTEFLEQYEPLSRKRFFYTGPESSFRPELYRYKKRFFKRYKLPETKMLIIFEDKTGQKPFSAQFRAEINEILSFMKAHFLAITYFGPAPLELEDIYPVAQSVIPGELGYEDNRRINKLMEHFAHKNSGAMGIIWDGEQTLEFLKGMDSSEASQVALDMDFLKVKAVADMQFGNGAGEILVGSSPDEITYRKSKRTGRIRNVYRNDVHILSVRAGDGYITLKQKGAELLHSKLPKPALRVMVHPDSAEFNRQRKNVFAKFVLDCDENLRIGDEALIVDPEDKLVAVGRIQMTAEEMKAFEIGIAGRTKEGYSLRVQKASGFPCTIQWFLKGPIQAYIWASIL